MIMGIGGEEVQRDDSQTLAIDANIMQIEMTDATMQLDKVDLNMTND